MKNPCIRECPGRKVGCRSGCEKFKEWEKYKEAERKQRQKDFLVEDYTLSSVARVKRIRSIK